MPWKDVEKRNAYMRKRYAENKGRLLPKIKAWKEANREKLREYGAKRRAANREKIRAQHKMWRDANPDRVRESARMSRSKIAPEAATEQYLIDHTEARGGICPKFVDPGRRGAPDRMVILPGAPVRFVELKRAKLGRLSPWQIRYQEQLRKLGQHVSVLWSKKDVDDFFAAL